MLTVCCANVEKEIITAMDAAGMVDSWHRRELFAKQPRQHEGQRFIAIKFSVRGRDLGSTVDEAKQKAEHLFHVPHRAVWSGEFEQMEEANNRLLWIIPLSLALIFIMLYSSCRGCS